MTARARAAASPTPPTSIYIYNTSLFSPEYAISAFHATPPAVLIKTLMRYKVIFIRISARLLQQYYRLEVPRGRGDTSMIF